MKAESTIRPGAYSVEKCGGLAEVVLYENITESTRQNEEGEGAVLYSYDEHRITVPFRENLSAEVGANRAAWLAAAQKAEAAAGEKKSLEDEVASLKADNEIMGAALEEVIGIIAGGE